MPTDKELMQQALDALDIFYEEYGWGKKQQKAHEELRARLAQPDLITPADVEQLARIEKLIDKIDPYEAQPEQEPVAWMEFEGYMDEDGLMSERKVLHTWDNGKGEPLYTTQPQREWQGLTDEERTFIAWESNNGPECVAMTEAKLKEKNT